MLFAKKPGFQIIPKVSSFLYCLDTYTIRDKNCISYCCSIDNLENKINIAWDSGFQAVELWHADVEKYLSYGHSLQQLKQFIENKGLRVPSYKVAGGWMEATDHQFPAVFQRCKNVIETAQRIGAESVVMKMVDAPYNGPILDKIKMADRYMKLLEFSEPLNIKLAVEFMSLARTWNTFEASYDLIDLANHPSSAVVVDTFHLWRSGDRNFVNFEKCLNRIDPKKISVVHFTDARSDLERNYQKDSDRRMPGQGQLNLRRFIDLLRHIGFDGVLSLNVYDQNLWNFPPSQVAVNGFYSIEKLVNKYENLADGPQWKSKQHERCMGLWVNNGNKHLDPRTEQNDRQDKLEKMLANKLIGKKVLDLKCGFSPLAKYVSVGVDAFSGCIDYLKKHYPEANWVCESDETFANDFKEKIDVLMHLGLGDSNTEIESHLKLRKNCKPQIVIIECCANAHGKVDNSKPGATERWNRLKMGLKGTEHFMKTNMSNRANRLIFIGEVNDTIPGT